MIQILIDDKFYVEENQVILLNQEYEEDDVKTMVHDIIEWCFSTTDLDILEASTDPTGIDVYMNEDHLSIWQDADGKLRAEYSIAEKKNNDVWHFESTGQVILPDEDIEEVLE